MAPIQHKRSPSLSDDEGLDEPKTKRRRVEETLLNMPPPEAAVEENLGSVRSKKRMFDEDTHQLLQRSVALILQHVGFSAATPEALEAFCAEAEACQ